MKECKETLEELLRLGETKTACYVQGFINSINKLPEAERPHGEWIVHRDKIGLSVECPLCHKEMAGDDLNYCCKCGADMKEGEAE